MEYKDFRFAVDGFVGHMAEPDKNAEQAVIIIMGDEKSLLSGIKIAERFADIRLDESTASIDPENETKIQETIGKLIENKTVLIIAHKLRSIVACDKIVGLKDGELMEQTGLYHQLYSLQNESMEWTVKA